MGAKTVASDRSQSMPAHTSSVSRKPLGQRAQTTPATHRQGSSEVEALRELYKTVRDGNSDMPLSQILDAQRILHEMNIVLNDRLREKM